MKVELVQLDKLLASLGYLGSKFYADENGIDENYLINQSQDNFLIAYGDHAWTTGWEYFDVNSLRYNKAWLNSPIVLGEGCGSCAFDKAYTKNMLFCSEVLRRGAISFLGATTDASASNWDSNQMYFNEIFKNIDMGTASKNVRNRVVPQAYHDSLPIPLNNSPYDSWDILIGDPLFNPNLNLHYPYTNNLINFDETAVNNEYTLQINIPELERNVKVTENYYWSGGGEKADYDSFEYPIGDSINRFYSFNHSFYNLSDGNLLEEGCYENNRFVFKINIPSNKTIVSIKNITYNDINKNNLQISYMPVYGPQESSPYNTNDFISYSQDNTTGSYYVYFEEQLSFNDPFTPENSSIICNGTTLPARNYTITFNLEDSS
jgi:hypothetical protein